MSRLFAVVLFSDRYSGNSGFTIVKVFMNKDDALKLAESLATGESDESNMHDVDYDIFNKPLNDEYEFVKDGHRVGENANRVCVVELDGDVVIRRRGRQISQDSDSQFDESTEDYEKNFKSKTYDDLTDQQRERYENIFRSVDSIRENIKRLHISETKLKHLLLTPQKNLDQEDRMERNEIMQKVVNILRRNGVSKRDYYHTIEAL